MARRSVLLSGHLLGFRPGDIVDVDDSDEEVAALIANRRLTPVEVEGEGGQEGAGEAEPAPGGGRAPEEGAGQEAGAGPAEEGGPRKASAAKKRSR